MTITSVGGGHADQPPGGCWCCGDPTVCASLLQLGDHPEVGVCFWCVDNLVTRKQEIQRATRLAPPGPWWRRLPFRVGFNRC